VTKEALRRPSVPLPHAPLAHLDDVGQLVLFSPNRRHVEGRFAGLVEHKIGGMGRIGGYKQQDQKGTRLSQEHTRTPCLLLGTGSYRLNKPLASTLYKYGPPQCP